MKDPSSPVSSEPSKALQGKGHVCPTDNRTNRERNRLGNRAPEPTSYVNCHVNLIFFGLPFPPPKSRRSCLVDQASKEHQRSKISAGGNDFRMVVVFSCMPAFHRRFVSCLRVLVHACLLLTVCPVCVYSILPMPKLTGSFSYVLIVANT